MCPGILFQNPFGPLKDSLPLPKEIDEHGSAVAKKKRKAEKKPPKKSKVVKTANPTKSKNATSTSSTPKGQTEYGQAKSIFRVEFLVSTCLESRVIDF